MQHKYRSVESKRVWTEAGMQILFENKQLYQIPQILKHNFYRVCSQNPVHSKYFGSHSTLWLPVLVCANTNSEILIAETRQTTRALIRVGRAAHPTRRVRMRMDIIAAITSKYSYFSCVSSASHKVP